MSSEAAEGAGDIALDWRGCRGIEPGYGEANPLDGGKMVSLPSITTDMHPCRCQSQVSAQFLTYLVRETELDSVVSCSWCIFQCRLILESSWRSDVERNNAGWK
jgi:hypothetical protein